ncbi:hypothetical protein K6025_02110 [Ehrlichia sp. JZT12]
MIIYYYSPDGEDGNVIILKLYNFYLSNLQVQGCTYAADHKLKICNIVTDILYVSVKLYIIILSVIDYLDYRKYCDLNNVRSGNSFKFIEICRW